MQYGLGIVVLFVNDMAKAKAFYTETLGFPVIPEFSSTAEFVGLATSAGAPIALQDAKTVPAELLGKPGGYEVGLEVADVDAVYKDWTSKGVQTVDQPHDEPFGRTFRAHDPEGHLLNVYRLANRM